MVRRSYISMLQKDSNGEKDHHHLVLVHKGYTCSTDPNLATMLAGVILL